MPECLRNVRREEETVRTLIESAAINRHDTVIRTLSCRGAQHLLAQTDTIALHIAAGNGHVAATRALLESSVTIDKLNSRRQTALHVVAESGHTAVVEALIEHGAHHFYDRKSNPFSGGGWSPQCLRVS